MNLLKKIIACFFALAAILPLVMALSFLWQQHSIREQMEERMEEEYLQTIVLQPEDFIWVKQSKEIRIDKHLFDVKKIHYKNGKAIVTGLYDTDEDKLHNALEKHLQKQQSKENGSQLAFAFAASSSSQHFFTITLAVTLQYKISYNKAKPLYIPAAVKEVSTPPPNA